jgi:diguanylate cyclase (GGDEF)-like protein/PAS domain S-box-containing protein
MKDNKFSQGSDSLPDSNPSLPADVDLNETLIQHLQAAFVVHDISTKIVTFNLKALELLGLTSDQMRGKSAYDPDWFFIYEDGNRLPVTEYPVNRVLRTLSPLKDMILGINRPVSNDLVWVQVNAEPVFVDDNKIRLVVVTFMDVSVQMQIQKSLHESENRYRSVINSMHEGLVMQLKSGEIVACNPAAEKILGLTEDQICGRTSVDPRWQAIHEDGTPFPGEEHPSMITLRTGEPLDNIIMGIKDPDDNLSWLSINTSPIFSDGNELPDAVVSTFTNITAIKQTEEKLLFLAHHDPLTKLPNRVLFYNQVEHALKHATRNNSLVAILFIDLDRFKHINDSLGHPVGDKILLTISQMFSEALRDEDMIARQGGDEFTVLLEGFVDPESPSIVAQKLLDIMHWPIRVDDRVFYMSASIGISIFPYDGNDVITLISNADAAMYSAKEKGRGNYQYYKDELTRRAMERVMLVTGLRHSIENEELSIHLQPRFELGSNRLLGAEALARWRHNSSFIDPSRFIPIAEEYGLIESIGDFVLKQSCEYAKSIHQQYQSDFRLSINISLRQLYRPGAYQAFINIIEEMKCPPQLLEFELTESIFADYSDQLLQLLHDLRDYGISISIDDFGKGYSSLSYLKRFPLDKLKIDASFIRDIPQDENDMAIARAIIALGHSLQLEVVAEGVETETQKEFLLREGCHDVQGYLYAKPMAFSSFLEKLPGWIQRGDT